VAQFTLGRRLAGLDGCEQGGLGPVVRMMVCDVPKALHAHAVPAYEVVSHW
jgi:hypothetical protein